MYKKYKVYYPSFRMYKCTINFMLKNRDIHLPIIIIGAGIAGIACAKKLQESGKKVTLLEARSRIGGRIDSLKSDSDVFDLGASWIHGIKGNPIWKITQENHIETKIFNYYKSQYFHENGLLFSDQEVQEFESHVEKIEMLLSQTQTISALNAIKEIISSLDYSGSKFSECYLKKILFNFFERIANDPFATNLDQLLANYKNYEGYFEGDEVIFPTGYHQVIDVLSKKLDIKLNVDVKKIICKNDYVKIIDSNNNFYIGSRVVVTVPLGVLQKNHIEFYPLLPNHYANSIKNIGFGSFNKVFFELEQPLSFRLKLPARHISDFYWNDIGCFNILDLSEIYKKPVYLMLFGGKQSEFIDNSTNNQIYQFIYNSLKKQFGSIPHKPKKLIITRWGSDAYSYGSFSFPSLKHTDDLVKVLHKPIREQIFFAGEHCSLKYAGTVHGAYLNGNEIAEKILGIVSPI